MVLAVDIGNSNICIGGLEGENVLFTTRLVTRPRCTGDEYTAELKFLLEQHSVTPQNCEGVIVCSVVPSLTKVLASACKRLTGRDAVLVSTELEAGLTYASVGMGQDRIADAVGAAVHYPLPCMTVDLGTATTYNVISADRVFLGGFIVPGVQTSLRAISKGTAQLPPIAPESPEHLIGRNTVECLNNGAMFGTAAMLDGLAARVEEELGQPLTVVATGGLAPYIMPCCKRAIIYDGDLLFKGLAFLFDKNHEAFGL
ncbi:MAG: type III pantothenate kinase [Oscillospiraceae bacterium]|nr:type III pantothenate kinase [Oscillospiraceae bacterium]